MKRKSKESWLLDLIINSFGYIDRLEIYGILI